MNALVLIMTIVLLSSCKEMKAIDPKLEQVSNVIQDPTLPPGDPETVTDPVTEPIILDPPIPPVVIEPPVPPVINPPVPPLMDPPVVVPPPPKPHLPSGHLKFFGEVGDHADAVDHTNIIWTIEPDAILAAARRGQYTMAIVTDVFYLYSNVSVASAQENWNRKVAALTPVKDYIAAFYITDEPGIDELTTQQIEGTIAMIKRDFPNIPTAVNYGVGCWNGCAGGVGPLRLPSNVDWVGFDVYYSTARASSALNWMIGHKPAGSKIFLFPDGFLEYSDLNDQNVADLLVRVNDYYAMAQNEEVIAMFPWVWSFAGVVGVRDMPSIKSRYQDIGRSIISAP